jgi:hypothetical protein
MEPITDEIEQDIIVIDKSEMERLKDQLENYKLLLDWGSISIYGKKPMF